MTEYPRVSVVQTYLLPGNSPARLDVTDRADSPSALSTPCTVLEDSEMARAGKCSQSDLLALAADMLGPDGRNTCWVIQADPEVGLKCAIIACSNFGPGIAFV